MAKSSGWLPPGYKTPQAISKYTKFEEGDTKIRILSKPIVFWEDWVDGKPVRYDLLNRPEKVHNEFGLHHCWAFKAYNYNAKQMEVCEINQFSIKSPIEKLQANEEWGNPTEYDITITKTVQNKKTTYTVTPSPKKKASPQVVAAYEANPIDLTKLMSGDNPFSKDPGIYEEEGVMVEPPVKKPSTKGAEPHEIMEEDNPPPEKDEEEYPF